MSHRGEKDILDLKTSLEKLTTVTPNTDLSEQEIMDVVNALKSIPINVELLRKTKIGQTLQGHKLFDSFLIKIFFTLDSNSL